MGKTLNNADLELNFYKVVKQQSVTSMKIKLSHRFSFQEPWLYHSYFLNEMVP